MTNRLLFDANVLIDYLRGNREAHVYVEEITSPVCLSVITVTELYSGVREGEERRILDTLVDSLEVIPVTESIAKRGGLIRRDYLPRHGPGLADAIVAATAMEIGAPLVTLNEKHFPMVGSLIVPYRKHYEQ